MSSTDGLLAYCRAGFEPELAAELGERAALAGFAGYANAQRGDGFVRFLGVDDPVALSAALPWTTLVFARQKLRLFADVAGMDTTDRVAAIMDALAGRGRHGDVWVEHPDTDAGKPFAGLARALGNALRPALRQRGLLTEKEDPRFPRLHVLLPVNGSGVSAQGGLDMLPEILRVHDHHLTRFLKTQSGRIIAPSPRVMQRGLVGTQVDEDVAGIEGFPHVNNVTVVGN